MSFEEMIAVLEKAFKLELKIVDATLAFDGAARRFRLQKYEPQGDLTESAKNRLLTKLENAFNRANDAEYIEELKDEARRELPTKMNPRRREAMVREKVRDKLTVVLEPLRRALKKARPFDAGNAKLVNEVRDVLSGDTKIDTKDLLKRISDALNTKIVDSREKVDNQIKAGVADDPDKILNINAWLEQS